jgi:hypothetical protein
MENSKLLDLIKVFSKQEQKRFRLFLQSPYFNKNEELVRFYDTILDHLDVPAQLERERFSGLFFQTIAYDEKQLNYLMSQLLKLGEQFLGSEWVAANDFQRNFFTLKALSERGLEKHYHFLHEKALVTLQEEPLRDANHFFKGYLLEDLEREHFDQRGLRWLHESAQRAIDQLDFFYFSEKLKYTCAMLNSQQVVATSYNFHFVEEVRRFVENNPMPEDAPGIKIYNLIFRLLTKEQADEEFQELKKMLLQYERHFSLEEMTLLYQYALNYCIRQLRRVNTPYVAEALDLYKKGVDSGILLTAGKLSPWHFKNIIKLALREKQFTWTEQFILEKNALLDNEFKADALHYNLAELYFYTNKYEKALTHLNKVEFQDVHYNLGGKKILAKIYYETDENDALESLLNAFRLFVKRNKVISEDVRKTYHNFIGLLTELLRLRPEQYPKFREKIENTALLTEKNWLLEQTMA